MGIDIFVSMWYNVHSMKTTRRQLFAGLAAAFAGRHLPVQVPPPALPPKLVSMTAIKAQAPALLYGTSPIADTDMVELRATFKSKEGIFKVLRRLEEE